MVSAKAYLGSLFMRTMTVKLKIVDVAIHTAYENVNAHDIALLKLEKPVNYTNQIKPISLPSRHQASFDTIVNSTLYVSGFGQTKNASQSNLYLRYVKMRAITTEQCSEIWGWKMRETLLCSQGFSNSNETTGNGDSGNGLITNDDEATIFGIVSYGAPGCSVKPKVFTRVTSYLDFIHSVTGIEIKA